jgi:hypothetical protein
VRIDWLAKHIELVAMAVFAVVLIIAFIVSSLWGVGT